MHMQWMHITILCDIHVCGKQLLLQIDKSANRQESKIHSPPFDPIICAQIVAFIEHSEGVFKLLELREMYQELMSDQANPCKSRKEPHATRFKDHLLSLLPEWSEFSRENKGRKDIYISHKVTIADELAKNHTFQSCQAEALILMLAAVIIHKLCLESQGVFQWFFLSQLPHSSS